jgi:hypothetical protein
MGTALNVISITFSLIAILVSSVFAHKQAKNAHDANLLPIVMELFAEVRALDFSEHLHYIYDQLPGADDVATVGIDDMSDASRGHAAPVYNYFNIVGLLVANRIVPLTLVSAVMGGSIAMSWQRLSPYVYRERQRRDDPNYLGYYEHVAAEVTRSGVADLHKTLSLKTLPPKGI